VFEAESAAAGPWRCVFEAARSGIRGIRATGAP
jgi:hypothetical protein